MFFVTERNVSEYLHARFLIQIPSQVRTHNHHLTTMYTILLTLLLALLPLTNAACYAPNGVLEPNTAYQPCISVTGINSMCCALNRTLVGGVADKCSQNGLCIAADGTSWRGFCTDKNWNSPGCLSREVCSSGVCTWCAFLERPDQLIV